MASTIDDFLSCLFLLRSKYLKAIIYNRCIKDYYFATKLKQEHTVIYIIQLLKSNVYFVVRQYNSHVYLGTKFQPKPSLQLMYTYFNLKECYLINNRIYLLSKGCSYFTISIPSGIIYCKFI